MEASDRNDVVVAHGRVDKIHGGPDGAARAARAARAMRHARGIGMPVPAVLAIDGARLVTRAVAAAVTGAELLADHPAAVLAAIGDVAARLSAAAPPDGFGGALGGTWVHGDLCPVNVLFVADGGRPELVAVVDWEDSRIDDPLVDVAWTEWLVRTWHRDAVDALPALYAPPGRTPTADARRRAMRTCLTRQRDREQGRAATVWDRRIGDLAGLDLG